MRAIWRYILKYSSEFGVSHAASAARFVSIIELIGGSRAVSTPRSVTVGDYRLFGEEERDDTATLSVTTTPIRIGVGRVQDARGVVHHCFLFSGSRGRCARRCATWLIADQSTSSRPSAIASRNTSRSAAPNGNGTFKASLAANARRRSLKPSFRRNPAGSKL